MRLPDGAGVGGRRVMRGAGVAARVGGYTRRDGGGGGRGRGRRRASAQHGIDAGRGGGRAAAAARCRPQRMRRVEVAAAGRGRARGGGVGAQRRIVFELVAIGHEIRLESTEKRRLRAQHRVELVPFLLSIRVRQRRAHTAATAHSVVTTATVATTATTATATVIIRRRIFFFFKNTHTRRMMNRFCWERRNTWKRLT